MKSSRVVAAAAAVVAVGCAALLAQAVGGAPGREDAGPGAAPALAASPVAPEVALMRGEVAALRAKVAGLDERGQEAAAEPAPPRVVPRAEQLAADEELHAAHVARVEDAYQRDPADPAWSARTQTRVWETIRQLDFMRDAARSVDCRSTMCRIEVDEDETGVLDKNLPLFAMQLADVLPVMSAKPHRGEDGRPRLVLYLMEADQRPPAAVVD